MQLPDTALLTILQHLDGKSLNALSKTNKYFNMFMPVSGLKLTEHVARERVLALHEGDLDSARRFKYVFNVSRKAPIVPELLVYDIGYIYIVHFNAKKEECDTGRSGVYGCRATRVVDTRASSPVVPWCLQASTWFFLGIIAIDFSTANLPEKE